MNWIILSIGSAISAIGIYALSNMHTKLDKHGHHWSNALQIGSMAGLIVGVGFGLIIGLILMSLGSTIF
jgi:tetrahydromethanopterin S-methyltransferase subunit G